MASIIATVLTTELAGARFVNHRESEVLVIIEVVQDRVVSLGEALFLEDLNVARTTGWKTSVISMLWSRKFQHLQSVADIA